MENFVMKTDDELDLLRDKFYSKKTRKGYNVFAGFTLPESYSKFAKEIEEFEVFDDDVWVTSAPKCGTTWTQEMVWCICNNLDFEAGKVDLDYRFPFIEFYCIYDLDDFDDLNYIFDSLNFAKTAKRPRFIKSHLPWDLLPKQIRSFEKRPKIIHVARNLKDMCVSFFYHLRFIEQYSGDFDTHCQLFLRDKLSYAPFRENILSYWNNRHEPNVKFIKFEDLKTNLSWVIKQLTQFLNVQLNQTQMEQLLHHLSFEEMKKNHAVDHSTLVKFLDKRNLILDQEGTFIRSGKVGAYKEEMKPEVVAMFDKWLEKLKECGLDK